MTHQHIGSDITDHGHRCLLVCLCGFRGSRREMTEHLDAQADDDVSTDHTTLPHTPEAA